MEREYRTRRNTSNLVAKRNRISNCTVLIKYATPIITLISQVAIEHCSAGRMSVLLLTQVSLQSLHPWCIRARMSIISDNSIYNETSRWLLERENVAVCLSVAVISTSPDFLQLRETRPLERTDTVLIQRLVFRTKKTLAWWLCFWNTPPVNDPSQTRKATTLLQICCKFPQKIPIWEKFAYTVVSPFSLLFVFCFISEDRSSQLR
jgi:hypothetical protein